MFCIWNPHILTDVDVIKNNSFIVISGEWIGCSEKINFINIYVPNDQGERKRLWSTLLQVMENKNSIWLLMGDFNEVREKGDRLSEIVCASSMENFNSFIREPDLEDFAMGSESLRG